MNQSGNILVTIGLILAAFVGIALLPPLIMKMFPLADLLFRIVMVFLIFSIVRGYLGEGIMTWVISGVLIYFLVIKYAYFTASVYVLQILLGVGFASVIIFGLGMPRR